jgi:alginate O-acetyltransferase complex protein AlgI
MAPTLRLRQYCSVLASYVFYGVWSVKFAGVMLATTSLDFFLALRIDAASTPRRRKAWLMASVVSNLGVLGLFKYYDFFAATANDLGAGLPLLRVALPIGISFYTFESMSYAIDVYRGRLSAVRSFIDYAHFVTMFPRLISGPIVRYAEVAEQRRALPERLSWDRCAEAVHFFTIGLAKKILIADSLAAAFVDPAFADPGSLDVTSAWAAALGYTGQLYFDFSGYCDMAVGLALLLGFRLPRNFVLPYRARDVAEFWRRWHVTLSSWLRDYLYIPLGGNRKGEARTALNLFLTMLLGGLWHGANWTFLAWGAYQGLGLLILKGTAPWRPRLPTAAAIGASFLFVVLGWVLFRSATIGDAATVYAAMLGLRGVDETWVATQGPALLGLAAALATSFTIDTYDLEPPLRYGAAVAYGLVMILSISKMSGPSPFLYFQF